VEIDDDDPFVRLHPTLVIQTPFDRTAVQRQGDRCACLRVQGGRYTCAVYQERPKTCRDVEVDGSACRWARQRVGLPVTPDSQDG
ncbi:MAG: YkgJ family cysteine cluster protein, partial [Myxococcota bacterium]